MKQKLLLMLCVIAMEVNALLFTPSYTLRNGNTKLYEEIIFCLSNDQLWTIYKPYYGGEMSLYLNAWSADDLFDDNSDIRKN